MGTDVFRKLGALTRRLGFEGEWHLIIIGAVIGTVTAFGAIGFSALLEEFEHFSRRTRGEWDLLLLPVLPMAGAAVSGLLVWKFAAEAKGHGVPQVLKAIIQRNGKIPLRVGLVKVFASIFTVGSGGSGGTEGPIVQIGAVAGSVLGGRMRIPPQHFRTLVGCGAAAGISSVFNAPIAGVLFVLEILLRDFSIRVFSPIVVASVFSAATTHAFRGENEAIFFAGEKLAGYEFSAIEMPSYIALGLVCGLVAVIFNKMLHKGEDVFERWKMHPAGKPVVGAAMLGLLGVAYIAAVDFFGVSTPGQTPAFFGNGYETIRWLLEPDAYDGDVPSAMGEVPAVFGLLAILVLLKALATTFTLGSGGSGGVFAPSLFLGAVAGGAFGSLLEGAGLLPGGSSPAAYALVGMAAVVAGSTHAPLTAILILFELTRDVYVLLPIMIAAVLATAISQLLERDSIYTFKLRREGVMLGRARDLTVLRRLRVADVEPEPLPPEAVYPSDPLSKLVTLHAYHDVPDFAVVNESGEYVGMVTGADMRTALIDREAIPLLLVAEIVRSDIPTIRGVETLDTVMGKFARFDVSSLCQVDDKNQPVGLITRKGALARYHQELQQEQ